MRGRGATSNRTSGDPGKAPKFRALALLAGVLALLGGALVIAGSSFGAEDRFGPVVTASAQIFPTAKSPESTPIPVTLRIGFTSRQPNSPETPELTRIAFELSSIVVFQKAGLPSCSLAKLYSTTTIARQSCAESLVGHGRVVSEVTLPGREPETINGHLLAFYTSARGLPGILAQVRSDGALPLTYVIPFRFATHGRFGTSLYVSKSQMRAIAGSCVPQHGDCFGPTYGFEGIYGHISRFELSLHRLFTNRGRRKSFVSADCYRPAHVRGANFPWQQLSLGFASGATVRATAPGPC